MFENTTFSSNKKSNLKSLIVFAFSILFGMLFFPSCEKNGIVQPPSNRDSTLTMCGSLKTKYSNGYVFVPCDYTKIQSAIDSSKNGDVIIVPDGEYKEHIDFKGKKVTLTSLYYLDHNPSHISETKIVGPDNENDSWAVNFVSGEDNNAKLIGLTIDTGRKNGFHYDSGIKIVSSRPVLSNLIISNNQNSTGAGGGIYIKGSNVNLQNLSIKNNSHDRAGGIYICKSTVVIDNAEFVNNSADGIGGAIKVDSFSTVKIFNTDFVNNHSSYDGGAIYSKNSTLIIENSVFKKNYSSNSSPGIYSNLSDITLKSVEFTSNQGAFDSEIEKAVVQLDSCKLSVFDVKLIENKAFGFDLARSTATFSNTEIKKCSIGLLASATQLNAEKFTVSECGLSSMSGKGMRFDNCKVFFDSLLCENNSGHGSTAGILFLNTNGEVKNSIISDNQSGGVGEIGGGLCFGNSNIKFSYTLIANNKSILGLYGGALYSDNSKLSFNNVTFVNNLNSEDSSFYAVNGYKIDITNSILWLNSEHLLNDSSLFSIIYSDVQGGFSGAGNISVDPQFCNSQEGNYSLKSSSPCIGAGENGENLGSEPVGCN